MERIAFERTQGYLGHLVGYLEGLCTSMQWEIGPAQADGHALPDRVVQILVDSGFMEGLHLKAQGLLSPELQEFIVGVGFAFEVQVSLPGPFKLPFIDNEAAIQRKTLNAFMEKAWVVYHGALLSAYAMRPLRFERSSASPDGLEETVRVREAPPGSGEAAGHTAAMAPESIHALNNALTGITSYVSLILAERKGDGDLQAKLGLVLEAASKAAATARLS